jgi:hypothetical protein
MKRVILFLFSISISLILQAQISKTAVVTPGGLSTILTPTELGTVTNLKINGTIDARDFKIMRDSMPLLAALDLSDVTIAEYQYPETPKDQEPFYPANTIPGRAFINKTSLTSIIFSASLASIGDGAFSGCNKLTNIDLPSSLSSIRRGAFSGCKKLTNIVLPSSLNSLGENAFDGCSGLTSIVIPHSIDSIPYGTFGNCYGLTTVTIPSSVTTICGYAFYGCYGLTSVDIPSSVTTIGDLAFLGCTGLTGTLTIPSSVTAIGASVFQNCRGLTGTLTIPSSVTSLGYGAFEGCSSLSYLSFSSSNISIGSGAFRGCSSLNSIYTYTIAPINLGLSKSVFYNVNKSTTKLYVTYGSSGLYKVTDQWKDFTNIVEMPGFRLSATSVYLSSDAGSTASINISSDVKWEADCDQAWLIVSPLSGIGTNSLAFLAEANLSLAVRTAKITISAEGVLQQTITILQEGVPKILNVTAGSLFSNLTSTELDSISVLIITGTIDARDFKTMRDNMPLLTKVDISGATISAYTGNGGPNEGPGIIHNGEYAANEIPERAFSGKASLKSFYFPSMVTSIGAYAFNECRGLTGKLTIPSIVTKIGETAFQVCTGLTEVTIPNSVTSIGRYAFFKCKELSFIVAHPNYPIELISSLEVFGDVNKTTSTLNVPFGSKGLYAAADQWKDFTNIVEMPGIKPDTTLVNIAFAEGSTATINITSNTSWTAVTDLVWLNVSPVSGTNNGTLMITANSTNSGTSPRTGTVKLTYSGFLEDITVSVTINQENQYDPELFSEYLFEESSGTIVIDSIGPNNGTIINSVTIVNGVRGGGVEFTGSGYINLGHSFGENVRNEVTLSAWIKPTGNTESYQGVIMHGGPNIDSYGLYILTSTKEIGFKTSGTSNDWVTLTNLTDLWDGNWHHVAVTYNGAQKVIYIDGIPAFTAEATGEIESGFGYNLLIGAGRDAATVTNLYNGLIDEVRIYNYALTSNQITDLYNLADIEPPKILLFGIASSSSLTVPVNSFTASDNNAVTGFMLTESATAPLAVDTGWSAVAPVSYSFATEGTKTLYAWAKDLAGNVSESASGQVVISISSATQFEAFKSSDLKVYPNPFSSRLYFEFVSANYTHAKLEIYNPHGQSVEILLDNLVESGVKYRIEYAPTQINTGIYIYKLTLDGKTSVGKVVYNK